MRTMGFSTGKNSFSIIAFVLQITFLVCFALCVRYSPYETTHSIPHFYPVFQDVHVMIFIGFGFLMTFLKKYSYGAVGYNLFIAAFVLQWATLVNGWMVHGFEGRGGKILVDLKTMITSDFAAGAVLITFGAVLGKVSRIQLLVCGFLEIVFYAVNENVLVHYLKVTDVGGSMIIHMFGAYFGLALAWVLYRPYHEENEKEGSVYHSDVFAMIGTIFLWMFWPSFNGAMLGPGAMQQRALLNTYYSLAACCITTFIVSPLVNKQQKIDMVHVQNATLAGGVAVGTCANLLIQPWGAILIGMIAGTMSTLGYAYVTPFLSSKLKIHDTCGVHNLHGMPALLAGICGAVTSAVAAFDDYKFEMFEIWPGMAPVINTTFHDTVAKEARMLRGSLVEGDGRSAMTQGGYQFAGIICTLALSILGGVFTGFILKQLDVPTAGQSYDDNDYWLVPGEEQSDNDVESGDAKAVSNGNNVDVCVEGGTGQKLLGASDVDDNKL